MKDLAIRFSMIVLLGMSGLGAWSAPGLAQTGLQLNGSSQYVTFGAAPELGVTPGYFTVELWFKKTGAGVTAATHSGTGAGITAVPLITKGRSEADGDNRDINYFLGIDAAGHLAADYEEGAGQLTPGLNHPVVGAAVISDNVWYHAAAVFDGTSLRLYLNGALDGVTTGLAGRNPRFDSIQQAALGTAFNTTGNAGYFAGEVDEARIWSVARSECEVVAGVDAEIAAGSGLVGRWGLNDGTGSVAVNSIEGSPDGTLVNGPNWVPGAPFDIVFSTPAAPSGLTATVPVNPPTNQVLLAWTDNSSNEGGFEIARSTDGSGGPFTPVTTVGPNVSGYTDTPLSVGYEYCYRVRAVKCALASAFTTAACATVPGEACNTLDFDPNGAGTKAYVTFGNPAALQLSSFSLELWLRRDGTGIGTSTGSGGIPDAIPLISKGRSENDTPANNVNYLLGIRQSDGVLCADFEEGPGGASPGASHPVAGTTAIGLGVWHHVAATYNGSEWRLYLDGNLQTTLVVNRPACNVSTVAVALASALNSTGLASGYFDGALDEVRIWNVARSQAEIQGTMNQSIGVGIPGLVGRWSFNETSGTTVSGSAGTGIDGTIVGTAVTNWSRGTCGTWVTAVGDEPDVELALKPIAPNPANDHALVRFALPRAGRVKLEILDIQGRRVALLADGEFGAGPHEFMWRGRSGSGSGSAQAGVYIVRFSAGGRVLTRHLVMLR